MKKLMFIALLGATFVTAWGAATEDPAERISRLQEIKKKLEATNRSIAQRGKSAYEPRKGDALVYTFNSLKKKAPLSGDDGKQEYILKGQITELIRGLPDPIYFDYR